MYSPTASDIVGDTLTISVVTKPVWLVGMVHL